MGTSHAGARRLVQAALAERRPLRAFLYNRTSSDPRLKRTSTRDQELQNRQTCEDNDWEVAGVFEDPDKSASRRATKPRPDFEAMVSALRRGECDVLVFCDSSRAYRDLEVYVTLRRLCMEHNVLLCYNGDVYDMSKRSDRKRSAQDAVQAEDEADQISERVLRTKRFAAERGAPVGRTPFGFVRQYDPKTGDLIGQVPYEPQVKLVNEAMRRVLEGETLWTIAQDFQRRGIPCAHGAKRGWESSALKRILINPANIGKRVHQKEIIGDAAWPAIVDEMDYYACRLILTDPARRTQRGTEVKYLLSGILRCGCGTGVVRPQRSKWGSYNYVCRGCFGTSIEVTKADLYVQAAVLARLESPEFANALTAASGDEAHRKVLAEISELQAELDEARLLASRRKLSVKSLAVIEEQFVPLIEDAKSRLSQSIAPPLLTQVAGPDVRSAWKELDLLGRREVLRAAVEVTLHKAPAGQGQQQLNEKRISLQWWY